MRVGNSCSVYWYLQEREAFRQIDLQMTNLGLFVVGNCSAVAAMVAEVADSRAVAEVRRADCIAPEEHREEVVVIGAQRRAESEEVYLEKMMQAEV